MEENKYAHLKNNSHKRSWTPLHVIASVTQDVDWRLWRHFKMLAHTFFQSASTDLPAKF